MFSSRLARTTLALALAPTLALALALTNPNPNPNPSPSPNPNPNPNQTSRSMLKFHAESTEFAGHVLSHLPDAPEGILLVDEC